MNYHPLKEKTTYFNRTCMWGDMDSIILRLKDKKIKDYWKKNGTPHPALKYNDLKVNPHWYEHLFNNHFFIKRCLETFKHCINMSLDNDVEEYLNSLEAIKNNK